MQLSAIIPERLARNLHLGDTVIVDPVDAPFNAFVTKITPLANGNLEIELRFYDGQPIPFTIHRGLSPTNAPAVEVGGVELQKKDVLLKPPLIDPNTEMMWPDGEGA